MSTWTPPVRRRRHRRHDPAFLRRALRRRETEGLSYARLAAETGIPVGTLASWAYRLRRETPPTADAVTATPADFVEVIPTHVATAANDIEVCLPGGIVVRVPAGTDHTDRAVVLRILAAALSC